ncbi:MAG TPA: S8 family peptidase, partial [Candidatus Bathyarchaeia archaeon]
MKRIKSVFVLSTIILLTIQFNDISFATDASLPVSGTELDSKDELNVTCKFEPLLWNKIQSLKSNGTMADLSLVIRLVRDEDTTDMQIGNLKNYAASLFKESHNATVYSICNVLPVIMARVSVAEAEKMATYEFVGSIGDGDRKGYFVLDVSRSAIKADYVNTHLGFDGLGVRIAIVDSGIYINHPDLNDLDDDPNTPDPKVIDEVSFFDLNDDGNPDEGPWDHLGHGTHVAGIASGTGEASNYRFVGVAPGSWIMNIKVGSTTGLEEDDAVNGIDYAISHGADIISISFGFPGSDGNSQVSQAVDDAVENGVVVTAGVGNDGPGSHTIASPADAFNVIAVGAVDDNNTTDIADDVLLQLSSRGPTNDGRPKPDVVAPGVRIISCRAAGTDIRQPGWDTYISTTYIECTGTSMATPHVAGTVALMLQANPNLTPAQIKAILRQTARLNVDLNQRNVNDRGHGIIDAYAAVQRAQDVSSIDISQMYDSWDVSTPGRDLGYWCYDYLTFTVSPPSTQSISMERVDYHYRHPLIIPNMDYRLLQKIYARDVWIDGVYYNLGDNMKMYLISGPRIYEKDQGYVKIQSFYKIGDIRIRCYWWMHVIAIDFGIQFSGGSSTKALLYMDVEIWDTTNYAFLPSTSETILVERKITGNTPFNVRDIGHGEYLQILPYGSNISMWVLKHGYFGNNPDNYTVANNEYVFNRDIDIYYQADSSFPCVTIWRKNDALPPPNSAQNDAGTGGDAGNTLSVATSISPGSYTGILCNSEADSGNDFYKFNVVSGQCIYASMAPPPCIDFDIQLYNPSGNLKAESHLGAGLPDIISYSTDSTGYWAIKIYISGGEGQYSFFVSVGDWHTIGNSSATSATQFPFQRKTFYASGRYWMFYSDGINMVYRTSTDSLTWTAATSVRTCSSGQYFSTWFDGTYLHYAYAFPSANTPLYYRRGTPNADGSITWSTQQEQIAKSAMMYTTYCYPSVSADSNRYPFISYTMQALSYYYPCVTKSSRNDGIWTTASGFPYQLSTTSAFWG